MDRQLLLTLVGLRHLRSLTFSREGFPGEHLVREKICVAGATYCKGFCFIKCNDPKTNCSQSPAGKGKRSEARTAQPASPQKAPTQFLSQLLWKLLPTEQFTYLTTSLLSKT
ncbi:hypothetical protein DV515_00006839 [Chloebia gouldiae]|uniref:Uncharacterized protein n=1 Tax=Chloebia gouldiae TaxID=44316 RepID=A0A3L8SJ25_CHLGU|nr:hypothetical protein DV515_00006839 [Chloebia gouldiae]